MRRSRVIVLFVLVVLIVGIVLVLAYALLPKSSTALVGNTAPAFTLTTFGGDTIDLEDLRGSVVVLNFWASWCVECDKEMRLFEELSGEYAGEGVVFLGADWLDTDADGLAYLDKFGITYPNGPDIGSKMGKAYRVKGVPETFFIGRDGVIRHVQIGPISSSDLRSLLDGLAAAPKD